MGRFGNGRVDNLSSKDLWVVAEGRAHVLKPRRRSPDGVDADGARATDGTAIDGHKSWWKVNDLGSMEIKNGKQGELTMSATWFTTTKVDDDEFGALTYEQGDGWGDPLP